VLICSDLSLIPEISKTKGQPLRPTLAPKDLARLALVG
jgi:hypothetical protein